MNKKNICCFIGHRKIETTDDLINRLKFIIEDLILNSGSTIFLFGSKSEFNDICYSLVSEFKKKYLKIQRIYVRGEYPYIDEEYKNYLLESYEDTYFPSCAINAGRLSYIVRNQAMIDKSDTCIFYAKENYKLPLQKIKRNSYYQPKSGTLQALEYAKLKKKQIILL